MKLSILATLLLSTNFAYAGLSKIERGSIDTSGIQNAAISTSKLATDATIQPGSAGSFKTLTSAGLISAPSISVNDPASNPTISFKENGTARGQIQTSGGVWYVDSDNTHDVVFQAVSHRNVGIDATVPKSKLDVNGDATIRGQTTIAGSSLTVTGAGYLTGLAINGYRAVNPSLFSLYPSDVTAQGAAASSSIHIHNSTTGSTLGQIGFGYWTAVSAIQESAYISYINTSSAGFGKGDLIIGTRDVTTDTAPTERMRVTSAGNVGIGTASPCSTCTLHVAGGVSIANGLTVDTGKITLSDSSTPAAAAACTVGQVTWDASYIYLCTASGAWKRAALTGGY